MELRLLKSRLGDERGSTLVEYAIVLIVFLSFVMGIMDFSRYLYTYHFVAEVAREGTRYASVRGSTFAAHGECSSTSTPYACYALTSDVQTYVRGLTPGLITSSSVSVTTTWPGSLSGASGACTTTANSTTGVDDNPGCLVKVVVSYPFHFMLPFLPKSATTWTLASTSSMIIAE
jgi:Flp pilus assembly protein TadG